MAVGEKTLGGRSLGKDFHRLIRNIYGLSGGQARVVGWDEADLNNGITVSVIPDDGLYKDGEFLFKIICNDKYPNTAPTVICTTMTYHPSINSIDGEEEICLNLLEDGYWSSEYMTLEDVVQGILFLMHNPNLDDAINNGMTENEFAENVRQSLEGGTVEGYHFPRNKVRRRDGNIKEASVSCTEDGCGATCAENVKGAASKKVGRATAEGGATV